MILKFKVPLFKNKTGPIYIILGGVSDYEARKNITFAMKTSQTNLRLTSEFLPQLATTEEANAYGLANGLGTFATENGSVGVPQQTEDLDFDPVAALQAMKNSLHSEPCFLDETTCACPQHLQKPKSIIGRKRKASDEGNEEDKKIQK